MKPISSFSSGLELNTDRIASTSKHRSAQPTRSVETNTFGSQHASAFKREVPFSNGSEFVEIDGKKYFFSAPRGTYVNIIV